MVTVSQITEKVMKGKPFLQETLSKGLINVLSLAEHIQEEVEEEINKKVKVTAIMMALRRLAEKLEQRESFEIIPSKVDLEIRANIMEISIKKTSTNIYSKLAKLKTTNKDFFAITQGTDEITSLASRRLEEQVMKIVKGYKKVAIIKNLSAILIGLPEGNQDMPGLYYLFLRELAWHNITIVEAVSTINELILIVYDHDVPKSFNALQSLYKIKEKN